MNTPMKWTMLQNFHLLFHLRSLRLLLLKGEEVRCLRSRCNRINLSSKANSNSNSSDGLWFKRCSDFWNASFWHLLCVINPVSVNFLPILAKYEIYSQNLLWDSELWLCIKWNICVFKYFVKCERFWNNHKDQCIFKAI